MSRETQGSWIAETLAVFAVALVLAVGSQSLAGAYQAELIGHPDESAHAVSGIMVGEYLRQGLPMAPLEFARDYYAHYPKVGIGHWPPVFYLLLGVWTLVFSSQAFWLLLFMAAISACAAAALYRLIRSDFSVSVSALCALAWFAIPVTRWSSAAVMPDMLVASLCLIAALQYRRYLDRPGWRAAGGFGLCASAALLTRGDAIMLALLPVFAVLLAGRLDLARRVDFWLPAPIVLALAGPWYVGADLLYSSPFGSAARRAVGLTRYDDTWSRGWAYPEAMGWWLALVCLGGLIAWGLTPSRRTPSWATAAGLAAAMMASRLILDEHVELRYTLSGLAGLLFGLPCAAALLLEQGKGAPRLGAGAVWFMALALLAPAPLQWKRPVQKQSWSLREAAQSIAERTGPGESVVLISGDVEGPLISEAAMLDPLPKTIFLRATKMLADVTWNGVEKGVRLSTIEALKDYLDGLGVGAVILEVPAESRRSRHEALLRQAVTDSSGWDRVAVHERFEVYRRVGPTPPRRLPVAIEVSQHRSGSIRLDPTPTEGTATGSVTNE